MTGLASGFALYLCVLLVVAVITSRRNKTLPDFLLAGRKLGPWVVAFSERASGESGWLLLGLTGLAYASGLGDPSGGEVAPALWTAVGCFCGLTLAWLLIARPLRIATEKYGALTLPRYLEMRLGESSGRKRDPLLRIVSTAIIAFCFTFYIAAQFAAAGKALSAAFGWEIWVGTVLGMGVIVLYTLMGGFLAVAWTDFIQGWLMLITLVALPLAAIGEMGGFGAVSERVGAIDPELLTLSGGRSSMVLWSGIISGFAIGIGYLGQPHLAVRYMSLKSPDDVAAARGIAVSYGLLTYGGAVLLGIAALAWFGAGHFDDPEMAMPAFAKAVFPGWLAGLLICGALAAMMSTADSQLLVTSSSFTEDLYHQQVDPDASQQKLVMIGRLVTVVVGLLAFALTFYSSSSIFKKVLFAWAGLGAAFGPPMVLCLWWQGVTRNGVLAGMISGLITVLLWDNLDANAWLSSQVEGLRLYSLAPGFLVSLAMTGGVSALEGQNRRGIER
ncbi:MAG: sodium/proline symporter [Planctomycetota bacterium]